MLVEIDINRPVAEVSTYNDKHRGDIFDYGLY